MGTEAIGTSHGVRHAVTLVVAYICTETTSGVLCRASSRFMFVELVAFETTTRAYARFEDSGVGYLSIHVNVLTTQELIRFLFTGEVED